jgi:transposase
VPAIPPYIIEPVWQQFRALLPSRETNHPLGCHRPRIPDRVAFEKIVQILVFGCAYWRIADEGCSATTPRRRRDEWIDLGVMDELEEMARESYDRAVSLELSEVAVDCCITKASHVGARRREEAR